MGLLTLNDLIMLIVLRKVYYLLSKFDYLLFKGVHWDAKTKNVEVVCFHYKIWDFILVYHSVFLIGIHSMQGLGANERYGVTKKRSPKRLKHTGNLFRKNLQSMVVC